MRYQDYIDAIEKYYKRLKESNQLPTHLLGATSGKLREECVFVFKARPRKSDMRTLKTFFEVSGELGVRSIQQFELDKFKPLASYLNEETSTTADKNMEILGWLLDFPPRPYDKKINYKTYEAPIPDKDSHVGNEKKLSGYPHPEPQHTEATEMIDESPNSPIIKTKEAQRRRSEKLWKFVTGVALIVSIGTAVFFNQNQKTSFGVVGPNQTGCMIWIDDHYEVISCDSPRTGGFILPLDVHIQQNLRRITRPDTIEERHVGNLWYQKRTPDSLDYFTSGGKDPVHLDRDLKRLNKNMYVKYVSKKHK